MGHFPQQTFIVPSVLGFINSKRKIIATISREAFFALAGVVSFALRFCHEWILTVFKMNCCVRLKIIKGYFASLTFQSQMEVKTVSKKTYASNMEVQDQVSASLPL